jgi:hypothetical protein
MPRVPAMTRLARFRQTSWGNRALLLEAALLVSLAELAVHLLPFRYLMRLARLPQTQAALTSEPADPAPVHRVRWAVYRATQHLPWRCRCLAQAVTAHVMLTRRGAATVLYIGVRLGGQGALSSHAWLRCGSIYVTGAPVHEQFRVIATFGGGGT